MFLTGHTHTHILVRMKDITKTNESQKDNKVKCKLGDASQ